MAVELSLKKLKALLNGNNLDLSMRQLVKIPVKALSKIQRATHFDFSNNLISVVPVEFCSLIHVTKLDLSKNQIVQLPEDFGKLINLVHLDLYKNNIKELPLSFGELVSLKWLDLKDNPLRAELSKAAGDCSDDKGCKQAAINVVQLMQHRAARKDQPREQQNMVAKKFQNSEKTIHEPIVNRDKIKKKKQKLPESLNEQLEVVAKQIERNGNKLPSSIFNNYFFAVSSLMESYIESIGTAWRELGEQNDLIASAKGYFHSIYMKVLSLALLVHGYALCKLEDFMIFYKQYAAETVNYFVYYIWLLLRIFGLILADLIMFIGGELCFHCTF
ncbi:unnamed protein product [Thelazia callipaeda]|uniref:Leucine-rich repeat-containing protein 59 n=1 Tax=Thelazia callipaeda TaxID=103827 RepID=A0A0N5CV30_THECL|nr:unnamed protein product [Thelazia callipaeda]